MNELKKRILEGARATPLAFSISGAEIERHFTQDDLERWASENALTCHYEVTTDEFLFVLSPSLAMIRATREGFREGLEKNNERGAQ